MSTEYQTTNILGADVEVKGTLTISQDITINGNFEGDIQSEGTVVVGENGHIQADIKARTVCIKGRVQGNVAVTDKCELRPNGILIGDLKAPRMAIEEGAVFIGRSEVSPNPDSSNWSFQKLRPGKRQSA
jgi:cytoskeletal protein CcmA (bactofilin family)